MKNISDLLFEAKFSNFNDLELKAFKDELDTLKENTEFLKKIVQSRKGIRINMSDKWFNSRAVHKSDKIEYGNKYLIVFRNPFNNGEQLTNKYSNDIDGENPPCEPNEDKYIICIGIADKFGKLHLVNQWEKDCSIQYKKDKMFMRDGEDIFVSQPGWYLYRKGYSCYYVHQDLHRSEVNDSWFVFPKKQNNTFVRLEECVILDISLLPKEFEKIQQEIDKKSKANAELQKQEEERLKKEEEAKAWWKARDGYKHLGCANGWDKTPTEIEKANKDPEAKWYSASIGKGYTQYFCDKYKITYTVDSSD